jgi:hypothetical protein
MHSGRGTFWATTGSLVGNVAETSEFQAMCVT